ncbi:MAG: glyceraldehyde-3-phosphate dehydrogenase, partial [Candidatus Methanomethylophilaceae archaeon]|nr:glyceraldehyde-3-phosphate dehydrogenase [Candidatus Methanomethylophilaceae archaeon]
MKVKVGINGYGTIGKRVATAVNQQDDMEIVGITKTRPTYEAKDAVKKGYPVYVPKESLEAFEAAGVPVAGTVEDMIEA